MNMVARKIEGFAELFHHYYSALATDFGCPAVEATDWERLPANERKRLVAATRLALMDSESGFEPEARPISSVASASEGRECGC